jgi:hypothetical protein
MSTLEHKPQTTDAISLIEKEVVTAENDRRPVSRQMLADLVHTKTGLAQAESVALVDQYCDEKAPQVPYYLQDEFAIPYLKVVAVINVLLGIGGCYWGISLLRKQQVAWPWLCVGTIFVGLGALAWVKSLERFAARKAKKQY